MVFVSSKEEKKTIKGNKIFYQAHGKTEGEQKELQEIGEETSDQTTRILFLGGRGRKTEVRSGVTAWTSMEGAGGTLFAGFGFLFAGVQTRTGLRTVSSAFWCDALFLFGFGSIGTAFHGLVPRRRSLYGRKQRQFTYDDDDRLGAHGCGDQELKTKAVEATGFP